MELLTAINPIVLVAWGIIGIVIIYCWLSRLRLDEQESAFLALALFFQVLKYGLLD